MVCSNAFLRPIYILSLLVALVFTTAGLFSPAWRKLDEQNSMGLVTNACDWPSCSNYWKSTPNWERIVLGLLIAAFVLEILLLVYVGTSWLSFFVPGLYLGITVMSAIATVCLLLVIGIYAGNSSDAFQNIKAVTLNSDLNTYRPVYQNELGYSFWLVVVAAVFMVLATVVSLANSLLVLSIIV